MKLVLVAEDNEEMREAVLELIEIEGFHAEGFADGRELLEYVADTENAMPLLILSDDQMPNIDGVTLRQKLRADPRTAKIPFALMSAKPGPLISASHELDFIMAKKPLDASTISNLLHNGEATSREVKAASHRPTALTGDAIHTLINNVGAARMHAEIAGSYSELSPHVKQHLDRIQALLTEAISRLDESRKMPGAN